MDIEPESLNIPLEQKDRLGYWVLAGCLVFAIVSALVSPTFAIVFCASSVVGLPVLWLFMVSRKARRVLAPWGDLGCVVFYLTLFTYIALAKSVLVPTVVGLIERMSS